MQEVKETQRDLLNGLVELGLLDSTQSGLRVPSSATATAVAAVRSGGASGGSGGGAKGAAVSGGPNDAGGANRNAHRARLVSATLCAGLYPQLAKVLRPTRRFVEVAGGAVERDLQARELKFYIPSVSSGADGVEQRRQVEKRDFDISTQGQQRVFLHASTANYSNSAFRESNFVMYGERQLVTYINQGAGNTGSESKVYLRDTSEVTAFALLFFGGKLEADYTDGTVTVDGWIR